MECKKNEEFYIIVQNRILNFLPYVDTRYESEGMKITRGKIEFPIDEKLSLMVKNKKILPIPTSTWMLLDGLLIYLSINTGKEVVMMPYKEFLQMRGLKDSGYVRNQIKTDLLILNNIGYCAVNGECEKIEISLGYGELVKGYLVFTFSKKFADSLKNCKVMEYSAKGLKVNFNKNRHAYYIQKLIDRNYRFNEGKNRLNTIGIISMLQNLPYMPSKIEVDHRYKERIISPFFKNLDYLGISYTFQSKKGDVLNKEEVTYQEFIEAKITIDYTTYPKHAERIEARKFHLIKKDSDVKQ